MLYLATQMIGFLIAASLIGILIGWWLSRLNQPEEIEPILQDEDIYAIKHRLDKCFDDNTSLRTQLKSQQDLMEKVQAEQVLTPKKFDAPEHLKETIDALKGDLQIRDDTIIALEKELDRIRTQT